MKTVANAVTNTQSPVAIQNQAPDAAPADLGPKIIPLGHETGEKGEEENSLLFKHGGRKYKLLKGKKCRDGNYYIKFEFNKRQYFKGLETNILSVAKSRAKTYIDKVRAEKWEDVEKLKARQTVATIGDVIKLYLPAEDGTRSGLHGININSAKNNAWSLSKLVREGLDVGEKCVDAQPLTVLTTMLVVQFQDAMIAKKCAQSNQDPTGQRAAREIAENSSKSIILQARSLFNQRREMVEQYEKHGLRIPKAIEQFMTCKLRGKDKQRAE